MPLNCLAEGWTTIQHRGQYGNSKEMFARNFSDYTNGFGTSGKCQFIIIIHLYFVLLHESTALLYIYQNI